MFPVTNLVQADDLLNPDELIRRGWVLSIVRETRVDAETIEDFFRTSAEGVSVISWEHNQSPSLDRSRTVRPRDAFEAVYLEYGETTLLLANDRGVELLRAYEVFFFFGERDKMAASFLPKDKREHELEFSQGTGEGPAQWLLQEWLNRYGPCIRAG